MQPITTTQPESTMYATTQQAAAASQPSAYDILDAVAREQGYQRISPEFLTFLRDHVATTGRWSSLTVGTSYGDKQVRAAYHTVMGDVARMFATAHPEAA
jgi:lysine/ornithine N-monooxygenase